MAILDWREVRRVVKALVTFDTSSDDNEEPTCNTEEKALTHREAVVVPE
jgi:hypothetical protein